MNFTAVPIIVICCYLCGGILGVVIFLTNPEVILDAPNIWVAIGIGVVSGASATGANQIIKQIFQQTNEDTENKEDNNE